MPRARGHPNVGLLVHGYDVMPDFQVISNHLWYLVDILAAIR